MADYIYLLQTRLTRAQRAALETVRDIAKNHNLTVFLVGGAVRDLTSGAPIRDLDVAVQGSALSLRKDVTSAGGVIVGEAKAADALYVNFPGGVRMELGSTIAVSYPKPGKPVIEHATILDDLRRRDFTANAMAISLNEGSYGLLMDPLNGIADIENLELRLVSNYGFIEDPVRMIRAARLSVRMGWHLEEKTQQRYETGKEEGYISSMSAAQRGYETEEIFHEEDPLHVLRRLESEGWAQHLFPSWNSAKINENELNKVRDLVGQLDLVGIQPDPSPVYFPILTAKLAPKDLEELTGSFVRPGFVEQANALDAETKAFAAQFTSKTASAPSEAWKMLMAAVPEQVLHLAYSSKSAPVQARFKAFFSEWPAARNKIPYQLMQEMRITPDVPGYDELLESLFFAIMDNKLDTPEATRAFLEPYSPPAPPPPVNLRRRAVKREGKASKSRKKEQQLEQVSAEAEQPVEQTDDTAPEAPETKQPKQKTEAKPAVKKAVQETTVVAKKAASTKAVPAPKAETKSAAPKPTLKEKPKAAPAKPGKSAPKKAVAAKKAASKPAPKKAPAKSVKKAAAPAKSAKPNKGVAKNAPKPAGKPVKAKAAPAKKSAKKAAPKAKGKGRR